MKNHPYLDKPTRSEAEVDLLQALNKAVNALEIATAWLPEHYAQVIGAHAKQARATLHKLDP